MINEREARQRLQQNNMTLSRVHGTGDYTVTFSELSWREANKLAYTTDDLEDAVIHGAGMRRTGHGLNAAHIRR